jgi:hypothetical protein
VRAVWETVPPTHGWDCCWFLSVSKINRVEAAQICADGKVGWLKVSPGGVSMTLHCRGTPRRFLSSRNGGGDLIFPL